METESDSFSLDPERLRGVRTVLQLALRANEPLAPPSRHVIDGIDVVWFRRGERAAVRDQSGGLRRLVLSVPDPLMSADHGRLVHARGGWVLDVVSAKNAALVGSTRTRSAQIGKQELFALGHTLFAVETAREPLGAPLDRMAPEPSGGSPAIETFDGDLAAVLEEVERVSKTGIAVLIQGETGTGKEVIARMVHRQSARQGAFVAVNCSAIPGSLVEAELFGHTRGAFTGAISARPGFVRAADGGTLFLDEIAELPLDVQATLLRVLQEREVTPIGATAPVAVDFRVVTATHRDPLAMVAAGQFREDLYARIAGLVAMIPPLRARRCDLGIVISALLSRLPGGDQLRFTPAAAMALLSYEWPRNIRELEQALSVAAALAGAGSIDIKHLPGSVALRPREDGSARAPPVVTQEPDGVPTQGERIAALLASYGGNVNAVARELRTSRTQVHRLCSRLDLDPRDYRNKR